MLKIEEGKYYKTRDGRKAGPAKVSIYPSGMWTWGLGVSWLYRDDGKCGSERSGDDLIAEWTDGPVVTETVTKTRIVPGTYDGVTVWENLRGKIEINFHLGDPTPDELDAAAAVLSALAKGLRDA